MHVRGSKTPIKIGSRVRVSGISETSPEYDDGEVIGVGVGGIVIVKWRLADETYPEQPDDLEVIP